ncbi:hypothetical protein SO802_013098 [Lithocarpus litseifolius]|uniref:No apical meristem-associated C-terminal domain-containing protein n=1 Tax=Lithocarpus litseifolius TaxID=425828 RepID=A0AAW2D6X7_9ROSI
MDSDFVAPFVNGSQNTSMPIQESLPKVEIITSNSTKCGGNFRVDENNLLVSAWLNISMDVMQGTEKKAEKFWEKIWQYFCENNTYGTTRSASSLASRWRNINRETTSSTTQKIAFAFEHCWVVLKNQPKWSVPKERSKGLPQTQSSIAQVGSNDDDTMVLERPIGRKAEKAKRKRTDGDKGFEDYLVKKLQYIQESHEQDKEALLIKADRV